QGIDLPDRAVDAPAAAHLAEVQHEGLAERRKVHGLIAVSEISETLDDIGQAKARPARLPFSRSSRRGRPERLRRARWRSNPASAPPALGPRHAHLQRPARCAAPTLRLHAGRSDERLPGDILGALAAL